MQDKQTIRRSIELLAPAKDAECARQAILHGADAVYIGAPKFGARSAAGNSLEDISDVVKFAHVWEVKVYVALNVILFDNELLEVEKLIWDLWSIGVDALIIQDMGITMLNLPPIPLHASTQTDNRTVEKVKFLEDAGFRQVVLARELSLSQIREISSKTTVPLEFFIHGALCVSYSGQCYISQALSGRSANRGECSQYCRLPYDLVDSEGKVLVKQKHLLSLKDLNLSNQIEDLIDSGISSFKIEGRLKDVTYVKNVTAWYRKNIDKILDKRPELKRTSSGISRFGFEPELSKSFNRGFTNYFVNGRTEKLINPDTPKSMGEKVGFIKQVFKDRILVSNEKEPVNVDDLSSHDRYLANVSTIGMHKSTNRYDNANAANSATVGLRKLANGDGFSFYDRRYGFDGFRVNRAEGNYLYPARMPDVKAGMELFRTYDQVFEKQLEKDSAKRFIPVLLVCSEVPFGFVIEIDDNKGNRASLTLECEKVAAQKPQKEQVCRELSKLGNTRYEAVTCKVEWNNEWFLPASAWADFRRRLCEKMDIVSKIAFRPEEVVFRQTNHPYPETKLTYLGNVSNVKAKEFYAMHGVEIINPALETLSVNEAESNSTALMHNKYCIKFELGYCPKQGKISEDIKEPLFLVYKDKKLQLSFDCKACEMKIL